MIFSSATLAFLYFAVLVLVYLATLFIRAPFALQRLVWVRVHPRLRPTLAEEIPQPERDLLGHAARGLKSLNLTPAANGHCPDFGWTLTWTQALFLNREKGERASVIIVRQGAGAVITIAFATECPNDPQVTTAAKYVTRKAGIEFPDSLFPDLAELYQKHQQVVANHVFPSGNRVMPRDGDEFAWLDERATMVAEGIATKKFGMVRDGEFYRYGWQHAGLKVWPHLWCMKPFTYAARKFRGAKGGSNASNRGPAPQGSVM